MIDSQPAEGIRLQKVLSEAGVASRRASEQLIADGRVEVNGQGLLIANQALWSTGELLNDRAIVLRAVARLRRDFARSFSSQGVNIEEVGPSGLAEDRIPSSNPLAIMNKVDNATPVA